MLFQACNRQQFVKFAKEKRDTTFKMLPTTHDSVKYSHKPKPLNTQQKLNTPYFISKPKSKNGPTEGNNDIENMRTNDESCDENKIEDDNISMSSSHIKRNVGPKKPMLRRVWAYLKHAWVGVMRGSSGRT